ncbi:mechanosensitive ion channel family protein [Synechococcus sp. PCC 7336]|uniref:mechanosensitive ion channel family protein n=1 Tax=Synechococcus sp. PCC 7336 TaxID=195250 RepID=UPI00138AAD83|nr:mechanosensitive ion channel domain-containing protein [Synechococcus sp. PCC 7336]
MRTLRAQPAVDVPDSSESDGQTERETKPIVEERDDREGWLILGGQQLFQLQRFGSLSARDRADLVLSKIEDFLEPDESGRIPDPRLDVDLVANTEYVVHLFDRNNPSREPINLFTVTRKDAANHLGIGGDETSVAQVKVVAQQWAKQLAPAISEERDRRIVLQQASQPLLLARNLLYVSAIVAVAIGLMRLSDRAIRRLKAFERSHLNPIWQLWIDASAELAKWSIRLGIVTGAIHFSLELLPVLAPFQKVFYRRLEVAFETVWGVLSRPILPNSQVSIVSVVAFFVLSLIVFTLARNLSNTFKLHFLTRFGLDVGDRETIATLIKYALTLVGVLIVVPLIGIDFSSLALIAGAVGLGIGIGLQNLSNNFISGIVMLFERPVQVGDFVEVDGLLGTVERVSLRSTIIRTLDSINVIVPNSRFMESNVISWSYRDPRCRLHVPVGVAYGSDTQQVREILSEVANNHDKVLKSPAPQVLFRGFGDSSLNFDLLVWSLRPAEQFVLTSELYFELERELNRHSITIPFPQRDLHIRTPGKLEDVVQTSAKPNSKKETFESRSEFQAAKDPTP